MGATPQQLTDSVSQNSNPTWSPDGEWIVFQAERDAMWICMLWVLMVGINAA